MRWLWIAAGLVVVVAFALTGDERSDEAPAVESSAAPPPAASASRAAPASEPEALPPSLRGTRPSGGLEVDAEGRFVATRDAVLLFEYFLSASHEVPLSELVARIRREIRERLEPGAAADAEAFLDQYLDYRERGAAEFSDPRLVEGVDLERRLQWLREFRRAHFGPELAERLFREEEDAVAVRLAMRRVGSDPTLSEDERRRRAAALEEQYPEPVRAARERAVAPLLHAREERALREAGAGEDETHALRAERFGPEAAERMRALDRERDAWEERMADWRVERDAVLQEAGSPEAAEARLAELRAAHFAPEERERVRLLDRIEAMGE